MSELITPDSGPSLAEWLNEREEGESLTLVYRLNDDILLEATEETWEVDVTVASVDLDEGFEGMVELDHDGQTLGIEVMREPAPRGSHVDDFGYSIGVKNKSKSRWEPTNAVLHGLRT